MSNPNSATPRMSEDVIDAIDSGDLKKLGELLENENVNITKLYLWKNEVDISILNKNHTKKAKKYQILRNKSIPFHKYCFNCPKRS